MTLDPTTAQPRRVGVWGGRTRTEARIPSFALHRSLVRGGALVFASTLLWQLSNFAFNSVGAHLLGPRSYGSLAAVVGILYLANPFFIAIQTISSRITTSLVGARQEAALRALVWKYGVYVGVTAVFVAAGLAIMSSAIARFLRIASGTPIMILSLALCATMVVHLQRGILQGATRFGRYAISTTVEALTKLVVSVAVLTVLWRTVDGAVLGLAASAAAALAVNSVLLRFLPRRSSVAEAIDLRRYSVPTLVTLLMLAALLSLDVFAAKRYLPAHVAGLYASASLAGKIVYFGTSPLTFVLFPLFSSRSDRGQGSARILRFGFACIAILTGAVACVYAVSPRVLILPLFGARFYAAAPYLAAFAGVFGCYAVIYLSSMYLLARGKHRALPVLAAALLAQMAGLYTFHTTIWHIVLVEATVFGVAAAALAGLATWGDASSNAARN